MTDFLHSLNAFYTEVVSKVYKSRFEHINMIARCFGHINKELDLKEVDKILNKYKNEHKDYKIDKNNIKNFSVNLLEKGRLKGLVDRDYIACLIKGVITVNKNISTVNPEKNEIERKQEENQVPIYIPAWIFKDEIVFSGAQVARDFAIPYFTDLLKIEIKIPHYDISKIYNDFKSKSGQVFGFGFIDRPNAISAGSIFGEMELDDPLVSELDDSDKNFIAINLKVKDKIIRVSVYSVGSMVIMQKWISMAENYSRLKLVREMLKAYEIKV